MSEETVEETKIVECQGREITVRRPPDGALVVLARTFRSLPSAEADPRELEKSLTDEQRRKLIRDLGVVGKFLESIIVYAEDLDWMDDAALSGELDARGMFSIVEAAARAFNQVDETPKSKAPVRRARR